MEQSQYILQQHNNFMEQAFENSHFSSIAAKFKHYKVLI